MNGVKHIILTCQVGETGTVTAKPAKSHTAAPPLTLLTKRICCATWPRVSPGSHLAATPATGGLLHAAQSAARRPGCRLPPSAGESPRTRAAPRSGPLPSPPAPPTSAVGACKNWGLNATLSPQASCLLVRGGELWFEQLPEWGYLLMPQVCSRRPLTEGHCRTGCPLTLIISTHDGAQ